ncbi:carbon-nitrogen hydrolase family protein [Rhizobium sp. LjRoot30]|uniref:carbon-nitrogen hydrolase family protein n=1 Tax=Rhizobium sp. LjRoot30 TaxID=3342320 RepID=UPI003ECF174D
MIKCAFVEWPEGLEPAGQQWDILSRQVRDARPDILVTNEMPFGNWIASARQFDDDAARRSVAVHEQGMAALRALGVPAIVSSRPVPLAGKLVNEAFVMEGDQVRTLHRKQFFPEEEGWYEATWFDADGSGFAVHEIAGVSIGVLLCTELMFNEHARHYGRSGAELIVVPRATELSHEKWETAAAMAAIVSGSYILSSNRVGKSDDSPAFGGRGLAYAPDGSKLAQTSAENPLVVVEIDPGLSRRQKAEYPCYVAEA